MILRSIDNIVTQQALIVSQVEDSLTGLPALSRPSVELFYQAQGDQPARPFPLRARPYPFGMFVFSGDPVTAFPRLSPGGSLDLRLTVSATAYETQNLDFSLSHADLELIEQVCRIDGRDVTIALLAVPLLRQEISLSPLPVHLSGRVVNAYNLEEPVPNAEVSIVAPEARGPETTDDDGFFTLHDMPVVLKITVHVQQDDFSPLTQEITLDYTKSVNQHRFALSP